MTTYVESVRREGQNGFNDTIIIDGYTSAKTLKGIITDIGKVVEKLTGDKQGLVNMSNEDAKEMFLESENSFGGYFLEIEEVDCASHWNDNVDEMEYKDGYNYYFCTRIVL